jgi:hypothetical protein
MMRAAVVALALSLFPVAALAEEGGARCSADEECTEYFMDGEDVTATLRSSDFTLLQGHGQFHRPPLIRARVHFINEMLKTVEDL